MASLNVDANNDLGSNNAFYDSTMHSSFPDSQIMHEHNHFAPWDVPSQFAQPLAQTMDPFEFGQAAPDEGPDSGSMLTRRRRAMLHRQSAFVDEESAAALMFGPQDPLSYASSFNIQAPANALARPVTPSTENIASSNTRLSLHTRSASWASASDGSLYGALPGTPASTTSSFHSNVSIGRAASPESTASTSVSYSSLGSNIFQQGFGHHPNASTSTFDDSSHENDSPMQQVDEHDDDHDDDEPRATRSKTRSQAKGSRNNKQRRLKDTERKDICLYFMEHPKERQEDIAARFSVERSTISKILKQKDRWLSIDDNEIKVTDRDRKPTKFPSVDKEVLEWVKEKVEAHSPITDAQLKERAIDAARRQGIPESRFKASGGWVDNFKSRHRIKRGKIMVKQPDMTTALGRFHAHLSSRMSVSSSSVSDAASVAWGTDEEALETKLEQYSPDKSYLPYSPERSFASSPERQFLPSAMPSPARSGPVQTPSPQTRDSGVMPNLVLPNPPHTISPMHMHTQLQQQAPTTSAAAPHFSVAPTHFFPTSYTMFNFQQQPAAPLLGPLGPPMTASMSTLPGAIPSVPEVQQSLGTIRQVVFGAAAQSFTEAERTTWESMEKRIMDWLTEQQQQQQHSAATTHFPGLNGLNG